jgi:hypothetical protein
MWIRNSTAFFLLCPFRYLEFSTDVVASQVGYQPNPTEQPTDITSYLANLCPLRCYVVNEVRRLADDSLSHCERPNASQRPEGCHHLLKDAVGMPG